jgi:hypothetical protein
MGRLEDEFNKRSQEAEEAAKKERLAAWVARIEQENSGKQQQQEEEKKVLELINWGRTTLERFNVPEMLEELRDKFWQGGELREYMNLQEQRYGMELKLVYKDVEPGWTEIGIDGDEGGSYRYSRERDSRGILDAYHSFKVEVSKKYRVGYGDRSLHVEGLHRFVSGSDCDPDRTGNIRLDADESEVKKFLIDSLADNWELGKDMLADRHRAKSRIRKYKLFGQTP